jgi:hypothetical protein
MGSTDFVLMTVECSAKKPTIEEAAATLNLRPDELDHEFGLVEIDPARHLFAVQAKVAAVAAGAPSAEAFKGPFANPRIETLGPRRKS